ncbi:MAG: hypothetical protein FRX49_09710 [Trebouxia sp. A1-2]|nr:MAG: hypothetical protein FRX49_09710 [Trebouxia sp. A1-2]
MMDTATPVLNAAATATQQPAHLQHAEHASGPISPPAHQCSPTSTPSAGLPQSEQQAAEEAVSCSLINVVPQQHTPPQQHAKPSLHQLGTKNVQAAGALRLSAAAAADTLGHGEPIASQGPRPSNTGCTSELAVDNCSPAGPADNLLFQEHQVRSSDTSEALRPLHNSLQSKPGSSPPREARPSAIGGAKSAETVDPALFLTDSMPGANNSPNAMPEASIHPKEPCDTGSAAQGTTMLQAHGAVPAPSQTADAAAVEQLADALTVPMQQDEDADASQRVAEPVEDVAASQEGPHTSQHTSVTASKMAIQQKRRQPSSSAAIGPASKRQCVVTRSSGGGQVQPLLTAPTDVTFQDKKGLYETSRSGRVRYPPLAFWMRETKVHDKLGGAIAIERPGGNCTPPTHPKPPQPPAHAPTRTQSRPVPTQSQVQAQTQAQTQSFRQPQASSQAGPQAASASSVEDPQAEVQSGTQAEDLHSDDSGGRPPLGKARHQLPVQHSRRHRASSAQPAITELPQDPPSPPFPYPILAGKSPKARVPAAAASSEQQTGQIANQSSQAQPQKQTAARQACVAKQGGDRSAAVVTDAEAVGICKSKLAAARPAAGGATAQLKRCGTCKTCMRPQSKQGCLVNKALREQALAVPTAPVSAPVPAEQGRAAKGSKLAAASKPEKAICTGPDSKAKSSSLGAAGTAAKLRQAETGSKSGTASRAAAETQLHKAGVSSKPVRQPKARRAAGADKAGNVSSRPQGSIRSALKQAVDLASDMEQPDADQQQQEAAQVLESLKNSPTAPARSRSAASQPSAALLGPSATALGLSEGSLQADPDQAMQSAQTAAASPKSPPVKQERRGRPRKNPVPDAEDEKKSSGPKRGRGRPRKTPLAEPVEDPLAEGNVLPPDSRCQQEQVLADATVSSVPPGSALPQPREADRALAPQTLTSKALSIKGGQGNGSQPADAASTLEASGQPYVRSPAAAGWSEDQKAALQKAYLTVKPSQRNFWQHVAKLVPGRTALECCNCKFDELPTPVEKVKQTARSAAAKDSSPIRPPALKVAGGRVRKPSAAATKQWARQVRWQQRAQEQSDDDSPQPAAQTTGLHRQRSNLGNSQRASATSTLLAAIHKQDKADKYIDRILRKQGGRLHKLKAVPVAAASLQASKGSQRGSQHATNGVMAELQAMGRQQPENDDMYDSEQDHYFSEDDA